MTFENMMAPVMYQDIASSYGMQPMPMMAPGFYGGLTPGLMYPGIRPNMRPQLSEDKFEKLQEKKQQDKNLFKKACKFVGYTLLALVGLRLGKKYLSPLFAKAKTALTPIFTKIKNFFTGATPAPPTP